MLFESTVDNVHVLKGSNHLNYANWRTTSLQTSSLSYLRHRGETACTCHSRQSIETPDRQGGSLRADLFPVLSQASCSCCFPICFSARYQADWCSIGPTPRDRPSFGNLDASRAFTAFTSHEQSSTVTKSSGAVSQKVQARCKSGVTPYLRVVI